MPRPILLVTGANAGLGLGLCERLLIQMANTMPPDSAMLDKPAHDAASTPFHAGEGCTMLLACRNQAKARDAVVHLQTVLQRLYYTDESYLEKHGLPEPASALHTSPEAKVATASAVANASTLLRRRDKTDERRSMPLDERKKNARTLYRRSFCKGTSIEVVPLDLASLASTKACVEAVKSKVPYLTHIILNAGGAAWLGIDWLGATWEILTNLHKAVTIPSYKLQRSGDKSQDGFGWVWQINAGGHYVLTKQLESLMIASPYTEPSRVIWTGSLEANEADFHANDLQCIDPHTSPRPYESTKYQCELLALGMDQRYASSQQAHMPRAYTAHPGIVATSIFNGVIPAFMLIMMKLVFYLARWTLSPHHPIDVYKGAVAASYVAVAPGSYLDSTVRYGAQSTITGREYVHAGRVDGWDHDAGRIMKRASDLVDAFDHWLQTCT